jgi:ABC-2 type transport system permease protein
VLISLLKYKWLCLTNSLRELPEHSRLKVYFILFFVLGIFSSGVFFITRTFHFLMGFSFIGSLLIERIFYIYFFVLFLMLALSSLVMTLSSLFSSKEMEFQLILPVPLEKLFLLKFLEVAFLSSWAFLFISLPIYIAYGIIHEISLLRYIFSILLILCPFIVISSSLGFILALLFCFISKIKKQIFFGTGLLLFILVKIFFTWKARNAYTSGDFQIIFNQLLQHTSWAVNPCNPTAWFTSLFFKLSGEEAALPARLSWQLVFSLASFMMANLLVVNSLIGYRAWSQYHSSGNSKKTWSLFFFIDYFLVRWIKIKRGVASIVARDMQVFFRDPVQYSQFGIFFGILFVYFYNLHNMRYQIDNLFWKNLITFLNLGSVCLTLATLSTRFLFSQISLEGHGLWILGMSPMPLRRILRVKFYYSLFFLLSVTVPLIFTSNTMLQVTGFDFFLSLVLVILAAAGLCAVSIGLGAIFPNFNASSASEVVSGFGGTLCLIVSITYIVLLIVPVAFVKHCAVMGWLRNEMAFIIQIGFLILNIILTVFLSFSLLKKGGAVLEKLEL